MLIFLDTEFTNFPESECDLISIGLVDENGREFYAESTQYRQEACSDFVKQIVLPLLGKTPTRVVGNYFEIARQLNEWLKYYGDTVVTICFDYNTDWALMARTLLLLPPEELFSNIQASNVWPLIDDLKLKAFWEEKHAVLGWEQHHALWDAHGNRFAFTPHLPENSQNAIITE